MDIHAISLFGVQNRDSRVAAGNYADIAHLSAAFSIKRRFIEYKREFAFVNAVKTVVAVDNGKYLCTVCLEFVITGKCGFRKRA